MKPITHRGYTGRFQVDVEDNIIHGRILGIRDIIAFEGATPAEAADAFREAVDDYLEQCETMGRKPDKPYSGKLVLRMTAEQHQAIAVEAELAGKSLNALIVERIASRPESIPPQPSVGG